MEIFCIALGFLAATAAASACLSLIPHIPAAARAANRLGPTGICIGCGIGLCGLASGPWETEQAFLLPWGLPFGSGAAGLDTLSRLFLLPVFGLGAVCALSGGLAMRHYPPHEHNFGAHWLFFALLILSLAVVFAARDAALFLLAWEIMSLSPFFLIDFNDNEPQVRDASWVYLVAAHLGAVLLLAFFALLWRQTGSTAFATFTAGAGSGASLLFVLAALGFGAKAGMAPLHIWLPEAHPAAPSHVSALLSGAMINAGLYGILRSLDFFGPLDAAPVWWGWALLGAGLGTGLMGILKAMAQINLKRLLAYSSVENMGVMLMGAGVGLICLRAGHPGIAGLGFAGAIFHMLNHASFKGLLFLCAGEVLHAAHTVRLDFLGGLQRRMPAVGAAFALGAAAIACLPPLNGFAGELLLALGMARGGIGLEGIEQRLGLLGALAGLALISGLAAAVFAKAYGTVFLGEPRTGAAASAEAPDKGALFCLVLPAAVCLLIGLLPQWALSGIAPAAALLTGLPVTPQQPDLPVLDAAGSILTLVSGVGIAGCCLALLLILPRLARRADVRRGPTWGCGYQAGTPRVQYTGASFSEPTAKVFAPAMGLKVRQRMDEGFFPRRGSLEVSAPDRLRAEVFTPLFELVRRACDALKILQHGRIHLYILYMLSTLVLLLIWGLHA